MRFAHNNKLSEIRPGQKPRRWRTIEYIRAEMWDIMQIECDPTAAVIFYCSYIVVEAQKEGVPCEQRDRPLLIVLLRVRRYLHVHVYSARVIF